MKTSLLLSLISSLAFAQVGVCKSGTKCSARGFVTQTDGAQAAPAFTWWSDSDTGLYRPSANSVAISAGGVVSITVDAAGTTVAANRYLAMGVNSRVLGDDNSGVALPAFAFVGDQNMGIYRAGADVLGISTGGVSAGQFLPAGQGFQAPNGSAAAPSLSCSGNSTTGFYFASPLIGFTAAGTATWFSGARVLPTSFDTGARVMHIESSTGRRYWNDVAQPSNNQPTFDLGGAPHPILQRRSYALDMGYESSNTPTFYPVAPRLGASSATVTPVDAAAASTAVIGTALTNQYDARTSTTAAAAGSISSLVTSAFIRRAGSAPRWCQKVSISTTSNIRVWLGIANALPGANDSPANSAQSFRYSTNAGDSKWMACYAAGVSTTCVDTGKAPSSGTSAYDTLCIDCREGGTTRCTWWVNGVATNTVTSGLGSGYPFFPYYSVEARSAAAVSLYAGPLAVETY